MFAEFYRIRITGTTPAIAHPCYSLKYSIDVVLNEDDSHSVDSSSAHAFDIPIIPQKIIN